jgi:esterase/lipase superfamily enzyme/tetratricopeptide (TPR) repeat protein
LAYANGRPLSLQDVSFVLDLDDGRQRTRTPRRTSAIRMLAVFSLPTGSSPLALRQERFQLQQLVSRIAQTRRVELRVVQFGATYEALERILAHGDGWDIVHFAAHGRAASLILETRDGRRRLVTSDEIVALLRGTRRRLRWVTLSTCLSGADVVSETRTWLGLEPEREDPEIERAESGAAANIERQLPGLARAIMHEFDCAVLAMRYPVGDAFASSLAGFVYRGVFEDAQSLARALQHALPQAIASVDARPVSVATPALFGEQAARLALRPAPRRAAHAGRLDGPSVDLPKPPQYFVGRTAELSQASVALAPESSYTGVLFHGMAGAGKTSCALELAYHYRDLDRFLAFVWFGAPEAGQDTAMSLRAFAQRWDVQGPVDLHGQPLVTLATAVAADEASFERALARLRETLRRIPVLVVLDNLESLLRGDGSWLEPRWQGLVTAAITTEGASRVVLTSRIRPAFDRDAVSRMLSLPVHALSFNEAALLARQLPNLGALLRGEAAVDEETRRRHREIVTQTLRVTQGHPKLIALAECQAANPARLKSFVDEALQASAFGGGQLSAFFAEGSSSLDPEHFLKALGAWTRTIADSLDNSGARTLFECLCWLEEGDRLAAIVETLWADIWRRLGNDAPPPDLATTVAALERAALIEPQVPVADAAGDGSTGAARRVSYYIHAALAETTRDAAGSTVCEAVADAAATYWKAIFDQGLKTDAHGGGREVIHAGLSAAPYFMRLRQWDNAAELLEEVRFRDDSAATMAFAVPLMRRVAVETKEHERSARYTRILGSVLLDAGQLSEAEDVLRDAADRSAAAGDHREASVALDELIDLLHRSGRSTQALEVQQEMKGHTAAAGLGPWTRLVDEVWRLTLLHDLGRDEEVVEQTEQHLDEMRRLPEESDEEEATEPWAVRELIWEAGRAAALRLGQWERALAWNTSSIESQGGREAPELEIARLRINDCEPLVALGKYDRGKYDLARDIALECRGIFERENASGDIAKAFSALASVESARRRHQRAIAHQRTALRHCYLEGDPEGCAEAHFRLATYFAHINEHVATAAHRLASALIRARTSSADRPLEPLRADLARLTAADPPITLSFAALAAFIEQAEGVGFAALFDQLPAQEDADGALHALLEKIAPRTAGAAQRESGASRVAPTAPTEEPGIRVPGVTSSPAAPVPWRALEDQERRATVIGEQPVPVGTERDDGRNIIPVYYVTDRARARAEGRPAYTGRMDADLHFGLVRISVPSHREMATLKRPRLWRLAFQDPKRHIFVLDGEELPRDVFCLRLHDAMRATTQPDALIFIHGYNVSFDDAACRTAQLAYDLHFEGAPILYSWPSEANPWSYRIDGENAQISADRFKSFLQLVLTELGARTVHVIAHSMGNRVLVGALRDLDTSSLPPGAATLREVVLAAPDVRSDFFLSVATDLCSRAQRLTLYASSVDRALRAAMRHMGGYPRAGSAGEDLIVVEGIDTVDASNVETDFLEHSYYGSNRTIISDLFHLIRNGLAPVSRHLTRLERNGLPYWVVKA